jgi:hypothetical protein
MGMVFGAPAGAHADSTNAKPVIKNNLTFFIKVPLQKLE